MTSSLMTSSLATSNLATSNLATADVASRREGFDRLEDRLAAQYARSDGWDARLFADALCLWRLCGRARCRRARACRGDPGRCMPRCAPLAPLEAREFLLGLINGKNEGLAYHDVAGPAFAQREALAQWREAVARS